MKLLKSNLRKVALALALGALSTCFTSAATAATTYDANAGLLVTLASVTDGSGNPVADGWTVILEEVFPFTTINTTGDGSANANTTSDISGFYFPGIGDSVNVTATSDGTATNGTATSEASRGVYFQGIYHSYEETLRFTFDYDITAIAMATGQDALASASVWIIGPGVDILAEANADAMGLSSDDKSTSGSFFIDVEYGGYYQLNASLNSAGSAVSAVPVPAAVWLFGSGLIGLLGVARRKTV